MTRAEPIFADETIDADIPCASCRYNLRGLPSDGRCPECGMEAAPSLWAYRQWQHRQPAPAEQLASADPRWVRELAIGAGAAVVVLGLMHLMALAPHWAYQWKSPQRRIMLGIGCTAWVLGCYAAWKLATPEPQGLRHRRPFGAGISARLSPARRRLRICTLIYLIGAFVPELAHREDPGWVLIIPVLISLVAGLFGAWFYYQHLGDLAWRIGSPRVRSQAMVLGALNIVLFFWSMFSSELDAPADSLYGINRAPTLPFGPPFNLVEVLRSAGRGGWTAMLYLLGLAWAAAVSLWLLVQLIRTVRMARTAISH